MDSISFLQQVVTTPEGYFELCTRTSSDKHWQQYWYEWPKHLEEIIKTAEECQDECDVYFSSYLFSKPDSHKDNVLPSRTIQQDLDDADILSLPLIPSILNETSPKRHQGFWILSEATDPYSHELLSKRLAYAIPYCDHSGWPLGHKVRVPNTVNHKYNVPHPVSVKSTSNKRYSIEDLELLPELDAPLLISNDSSFINSPPLVYPIGPYELVESVKDHLTSKVYAEYISGDVATDRSNSLFALIIQCFKAGLNREQVYWVAFHSHNNKFKDLRFNQERELAKDVLRAERAFRNLSLNIRELINDQRKNTKLLKSERNRVIYELVLDTMKQEGDFVSLVDGRKYYTLRDQGRPMGVGHYNTPLAALLDTRFGLNKSEQEQNFVVNSLVGYVDSLPDTSIGATLSHYDYLSKNLLIHTGRKLVYSITPEEITTVTNGTYGILFQWDRIIESFTPLLKVDPDFDWCETLFGSIPNTLNVNEEEAKAILKVWTLFALLRNAANTRPILALLGQPGSAKTTITRKLYAFFYGRHVDVSGVTNPQSFDMASANLPFFVLDNLDTWEKWIPDRLAQSAGKTDVIVRKLYSDAQVVRLKRQAMIAVTAHDPKFGRADVADRMIILSLLRFENLGIKFVDEADLINEVLRNRNKMWGAVIRDLQRVISTPLVDTDLQLRIQDFAKMGEWIASAVGVRDMFRQAVNKLRTTQTVFNLDEESILVSAMQKWLAKTACHPQQKTQEQLYQELLLIVPKEDLNQFIYIYKSSSHLGRKLSTLQSTLSTIMDVEFSIRKDGQRIWHIKCKDDDTNAT